MSDTPAQAPSLAFARIPTPQDVGALGGFGRPCAPDVDNAGSLSGTAPHERYRRAAASRCPTSPVESTRAAPASTLRAVFEQRPSRLWPALLAGQVDPTASRLPTTPSKPWLHRSTKAADQGAGPGHANPATARLKLGHATSQLEALRAQGRIESTDMPALLRAYAAGRVAAVLKAPAAQRRGLAGRTRCIDRRTADRTWA